MNSRLWIGITLLVSAFVLIVQSSSRNALDPSQGLGKIFSKNENAVLGSDGLPASRKPTELFDGAKARPPEDIMQVPPVDETQRAAVLEAGEMYKAQVKAKRREHTTRIRSLAGYPQRVAIQSGGTRYDAIPGLFAIAESEASRVSGSEVSRGAGYIFFEVAPGQNPPEGSLPAVYNPSTSRLGAVTGMVTVEFKNAVDTAAIARDFRMLSVQSFDHLKVGILKTERPLEIDLVGLLRAIQSDKRVSSAALEIVENVNVPR